MPRLLMIETPPIVSIVLPVWNGQRYLADAVRSVLSQTIHEFELIIVNDCSTDKSAEVAEGFARRDARVKVLHNPENLKVPLSLNRGFEIARGKYYTWTSDDNILHPKFLDVLMAELEANDADIVYSDFNSVDSDGAFLNLTVVEDPEALVSHNSIGASFLYKKEVHDRLRGYDPKRFLYEDYDFWVRAYIAGFKFYKSDCVVYDYRRHPNSLTSSRAMPCEFICFLYDIRNTLKNVGREAAFKARKELLAYRRSLGIRRWLVLFGEAAILNPSGAARILARMAGNFRMKLKAALLSGPT